MSGRRAGLLLVLLSTVAAALSVAGILNTEGGLVKLVWRLALLALVALAFTTGVGKLRPGR